MSLQTIFKDSKGRWRAVEDCYMHVTQQPEMTDHPRSTNDQSSNQSINQSELFKVA